jgi:beta-lactamase class A
MGALAGCGGAQTDDASTVAKAVTPPALPETTTTTTTEGVPASNALEPVVGETGPAVNATDSAVEREDPDAGSRAPAGGSQGAGRILSAADRASFERLAASLGGQSGLAVSGLGVGESVERVGALRSVVAWSTAKIPVAMAVIAGGGAGAQQTDLTSAVTASDNTAALRLWASLGGGQDAASAVDGQLRQAGDTHTHVESRALRGSGYTPFGQTAWALSDQARFTAGLPCTEAGTQVLALMDHVVAGQRWGLGSAGVDAQFKGGWGPGSQPGSGSGYLDRQMGVMTIHGKPLAVAIATLPADGSHEAGTRNLTAIARWLVGHADVRRLPARATC